jgi:hypothetical protein
VRDEELLRDYTAAAHAAEIENAIRRNTEA